MKLRMLFLVGLGLSLVACGESGDTGAADSGTALSRCSETSSLCVDLHVPDDFVGTPRQLIAGLFESLPPQGPPLVVISIVDQPVIAPGQHYELTATELSEEDPADYLPGDYYVYVVLYNQGGGQFVPVAGIDYTVETTAKRRVGEAAVNLPDMMFGMAE